MMRLDAEYQSLLALSEREGTNPYRVQAAGGNTSIKRDGVMWIKASGTWLAQARQNNIMVPVRLEPLLEALEQNDPSAEKAQAFVITEENPANLRPSIETTVHAIMPQHIVVHVHCVHTIAHAVQKQGESVLNDVLAGYNWAWIPYVRPGLPLSKEIAQRLQHNTNVLVLGNHGLVVAADSVDEVRQLLDSVCAALQLPSRLPDSNALSPDLSVLQEFAAGSDYRLPDDEHCHAIAFDSDACKLAAGGSLYPDHVIFLGAGTVVARAGETIATILERADASKPPVMLVVPKLGVLLHRDASSSAQALARCLSDVLLRVPVGKELRYLRDDEEYALLNWDAEIYRQSIDKQL